MRFEIIWDKIVRCAGGEFTTKSGLPFRYQILNGAVVPDRTEYPLSKSNFEKAAKIDNLQSPSQISDLVRGPAYVYAILTDARIR